MAQAVALPTRPLSCGVILTYPLSHLFKAVSPEECHLAGCQLWRATFVILAKSSVPWLVSDTLHGNSRAPDFP